MVVVAVYGHVPEEVLYSRGDAFWYECVNNVDHSNIIMNRIGGIDQFSYQTVYYG